jgi:hypothetical protein
MKVKHEYDGTYSLSEIAGVVEIPEGSLFRHRWRAELFTTYDFLKDPDMAFRIATSKGAAVRGPMPVARFSLEDAARLLIVGHLGNHWGMDRSALLKMFGKPFALPTETRGDGHTPATEQNVPHFMAIYDNGESLAFRLFDTEAEAEAFKRRKASAMLLSLDAFRDVACNGLAEVDLARERKAAARAAARKARPKPADAVADAAEKEVV